MNRIVTALAAALICQVAVGCAAPSSDGSDVNVDVDVDGVAERAALTSGSWTMNATSSSVGPDVKGTLTLSGPSGSATPAGICVLRQVTGGPRGVTPVSCSGDNATGDAACGGGAFRCLRENNSGTPYCYQRVACTSGNFGPGTYVVSTPGLNGAKYIANGCFGNSCPGGRSTSFIELFNW